MEAPDLQLRLPRHGDSLSVDQQVTSQRPNPLRTERRNCMAPSVRLRHSLREDVQMTDWASEHQQLFHALTQLEADAKALDLRDPVAWTAYEHKLSAVRERIVAFGRHVRAEAARRSTPHRERPGRSAVTSPAPTFLASPPAVLRRRQAAR